MARWSESHGIWAEATRLVIARSERRQADLRAQIANKRRGMALTWARAEADLRRWAGALMCEEELVKRERLRLAGMVHKSPLAVRRKLERMAMAGERR